MSVESKVAKVVSSYITAMHEWETEAERIAGGSVMERAERMERMLANGEMEALESARQRILSEYCTSRKRISRGGWGTTPRHHPELEHVEKIQPITDTQVHAWTDSTDRTGFHTRRRYELQLCEGIWLIDQHFVLCEGEESPEIY